MATDTEADSGNADLGHDSKADVEPDTTDDSGAGDHGSDAPSCPDGLGDCDGDPANGCETALGTFYHCGACADRCEVGEVCDGDGDAGSCQSYGFVTLSAGYRHVCAIDGVGDAWCWGLNERGQLGNGSTATQLWPARVDGIADVSQIAAGRHHTCAIHDGGRVSCWGANEVGQLGNGGTSDISRPVPVVDAADKTLSGVTQLAVGRGPSKSSFSCAVVADADLWCWGADDLARLGDWSGGDTSVAVPVFEGVFSSVTVLALGDDHACAYTDRGLRCWGSNAEGMAGEPDPVVTGLFQPRGVDVPVTALALAVKHGCALGNDGVVRCWGDPSNWRTGPAAPSWGSAAQVAGLGHVEHLAAGGGHTCVVTTAGDLHCWGLNTHGQCGTGTRLDARDPSGRRAEGAAGVAAGAAFTCGLAQDGTFKCWGNNAAGAFGDGGASQTEVPLRANVPVAVADIALHEHHMCALDVDGGVWCWGRNDAGQVGLDALFDQQRPLELSIPRASAITTAGASTCAQTDSGLRCWGDNRMGQLGAATPALSASPVAVHTGRESVRLASGMWSHCAADAAGVHTCWGANAAQECAVAQIGQSIPPTPAALDGFALVDAGAAHGCGILAQRAWCWGANHRGQLGRGMIGGVTPGVDAGPAPVVGLPDQQVVDLAVGRDHACAILNDPSAGTRIACWGDNGSGQGASTPPTTLESPHVIPYPGATAIAAGAAHTCVIAAGTVACWGQNYHGQLGRRGDVWSPAPVPVDQLAPGASAIDAGAEHTCAVVGGEVWCWGSGSFGQLGDGRMGDTLYASPLR